MKIYKIIIKILMWLDNNTYILISHLSSKLNNGIHPKHRIMDYHQFFLKNIDSNSTILDIGTGIGAVAYDLAKKARFVQAIDIKKDYIEIAKEKHNRDNIQYIIGDATTYNFNDHFDYIILSNVLEHIKNRIDFLAKIKPLAKYLLIRVPMINRSWLPMYKRELGMEYRLDSSHYIEYTFKTFSKEIESVGLNIFNYNIQFGEIWAKIG